LGEIWELERISLRLWPGGTPLQTIITGIRELLDSGWNVAIDDIEQVTVTVAPGVHDAHARFVEPTGTFESLLSIHFVVAVFLQEHGLWLDHTGPDHYADPKLRAFQRHRVRLKSDPSLTPTTCRIEIKSDQGVAKVTVEAPKGHPDNPAARQQLMDKFLRCTSGRLEAPEDLAAALLKLEDAGHVSEVTLPMRKVVV
jgi:2-methylcitrate dehydratase PrpD